MIKFQGASTGNTLVTMPDSLWASCKYSCAKEVLGTNGEGAPIYSAGAVLTCEWGRMSHTDWLWLCTTLLNNQDSATFTTVIVYRDDNPSTTLITYTKGVGQKPTSSGWDGGQRANVVFKVLDIS